MSIRVRIFGSTGVNFRRLPLMSGSAQRRRMALSNPRLAKFFSVRSLAFAFSSNQTAEVFRYRAARARGISAVTSLPYRNVS
jgi:hypothetical protein